jgi:predicted nucleotidyltransferase
MTPPSARPLAAVTLDGLRTRRREIVDLAARRGAHGVQVFGSVARGEQRPGSDIDLLVEFEPGRSLFDLGGLICDLEDLLGGPVDVVTADELRPQIRERVLADAVPL